MRYAWDFASEAQRFPAPIRPAARAFMPAVRRWDRGTAQRVTAFIANSSAVAARIECFYGRSAEVIHPPVETDYFTPTDRDRDREGFLYVGRLVGYKRADLAVECFRGLPHRLTVIGEGHLGPELRATAPPNVTFISAVSKSELREHYRRAQALVFPADEDFGITMAEAQACGTPVIGLRAGGALDLVRDPDAGFLADAPDPGELRQLIRRAAVTDFDHRAISAAAQRFSCERFGARIVVAAEVRLRLAGPGGGGRLG
jgi:glycosyltransferase involved in cell wall biosynthesis